MPYISTEQVAEIRTALKTTFPKVKFSIRRRGGHAVTVAILKSNVDFGTDDYIQVNEYHYQNQEYSAAAKKMIKKILDLVQKTVPNYTVSEDGDYGSIPKYYFDLHVGTWNKPYQKKAV